MVLASFTEAIGCVLAGKRVVAHAANGERPDLQIVNDEVRLGGKPLAPGEVFLTYETEHEPSLLLVQVLHELLRGSEAVYESIGPHQATAYISGSEMDSGTIYVNIAAKKGNITPLASQWRRVPNTKTR